MATSLLKSTIRTLIAFSILSLPLAAHAADDAATLFKAKCSLCHGADGSGNTSVGKKMSAPDLRTADVQKQSDKQLAEYIANGKGKKMPPFKNSLKEDQIEQLVAYIRELGKK
ncbi:MAG: cytochrome c6 [Acidobacteriaceae bacterium]|jgi:mono/diheme cytochrome c family protein